MYLSSDPYTGNSRKPTTKRSAGASTAGDRITGVAHYGQLPPLRLKIWVHFPPTQIPTPPFFANGSLPVQPDVGVGVGEGVGDGVGVGEGVGVGDGDGLGAGVGVGVGVDVGVANGSTQAGSLSSAGPTSVESHCRQVPTRSRI